MKYLSILLLCSSAYLCSMETSFKTELFTEEFKEFKKPLLSMVREVNSAIGDGSRQLTDQEIENAMKEGIKNQYREFKNTGMTKDELLKRAAKDKVNGEAYSNLAQKMITKIVFFTIHKDSLTLLVKHQGKFYRSIPGDDQISENSPVLPDNPLS